MQDKIRWKLLKHIAKKETGRKVIFVASAGEKETREIRGGVAINPTQIVVYLNLELNKKVKDVILTLAHELAHIKEPEEKVHSNEFYDEMNRLQKVITEEYEKTVLRNTLNKGGKNGKSK